MFTVEEKQYKTLGRRPCLPTRASLDQFGALGKILAVAPCITANPTTNNLVHSLTQKLHSFSLSFSLLRKQKNTKYNAQCNTICMCALKYFKSASVTFGCYIISIIKAVDGEIQPVIASNENVYKAYNY